MRWSEFKAAGDKLVGKRDPEVVIDNDDGREGKFQTAFIRFNDVIETEHGEHVTDYRLAREESDSIEDVEHVLQVW